MDMNMDMDTSTSSSSSSSETSSDENNYLEFLANMPERKPKKFFNKTNMFELYDDDEFEKRFRLPKVMVENLTQRVGHTLSYTNKKNNPVPPRDQILITLRFYATASFQIAVADLFGISQPTASRIILRVSKAIAELAREEIKFPSIENIHTSKEGFYRMGGIPNIIGAIDGTHIPIESTGGPFAEQFRCRKGYFSINTQIVVDSNMRICDIVARWPGSTHDQMVFNFSKIKAQMEAGEFLDGILIGDGGYACKNYLITPLGTPLTEREKNFNRAFVRTRRIVEQTIGVWKRRFPVIGTKLRTHIDTSVIIIVATAVLHNLLKDRNVPPSEVDVVLEADSVEIVFGEESDFSARQSIIDNFFS